MSMKEKTQKIKSKHKSKKTYLDFTAYIWQDHKELDPSYVQKCKEFLAQLPRSNPFQTSDDKQQAASDQPTKNKKENK